MSSVPTCLRRTLKGYGHTLQYFFSTFVFINLDPPSNCTALSDITPELSKTYVHLLLITVVFTARCTESHAQLYA